MLADHAPQIGPLLADLASWLGDPLQTDFFRRALVAGLLVSVTAGIVGTYVVVNRMVFLTGAIAHTAYGGVGLGVFLPATFGGAAGMMAGDAVDTPFLGIPIEHWPTVGAMVFAVVAAIGMGIVQEVARERADTLIGALWAVGMAVGIVLVDQTPGYKADLMSYLFGSLLLVSWTKIYIVAILNGVLLLFGTIAYKELMAISYDSTFAAIRGVPVRRVRLVALALVAAAVVMLMQIVGLILVIAMLSLPIATAGAWTSRARTLILLAVLVTAVTTTIGLYLSWHGELTAGAAIVLVTAGFYLVSVTLVGIRRAFRGSPARDASPAPAVSSGVPGPTEKTSR